MKIKRKFSPEEKLKIVLEVIKGEATHAESCRKYGLAPSLLSTWKDMFTKNAVKVFETDRTENEKDSKIKKFEYVIGKLTTQNDFLEHVLASLK